MLKHAHGKIRKLHIFKLREDSVDHASYGEDTAAWCGSNIEALETNLNQRGITVKVTAIPVESGVYLTFPQTREELRVIKHYYEAEEFEVKDATDKQLALVRNAILIYRNTKRDCFEWIDAVDNQLVSLAESKSHDQQAAHELADGPLSGFVAVWIEWDLGALDIADKTKRTDLEEFLLKNGVLADVPVIQPLKYDLCEILVKDSREDEIKLLFAGKMYAEFDEKSALLSICGYTGSLRIVLTSYESDAGAWVERKVLVDNRIKQLEEKLKGRIESGSSKI